MNPPSTSMSAREARRILARLGVPQTRLARVLGVNLRTVQAWLSLKHDDHPSRARPGSVIPSPVALLLSTWARYPETVPAALRRGPPPRGPRPATEEAAEGHEDLPPPGEGSPSTGAEAGGRPEHTDPLGPTATATTGSSGRRLRLLSLL